MKTRLMKNHESIKHLLLNVSNIVSKYNEIARITGENFNIFSIMSMEEDEVYTHSAIIAELLNPLGSHGQGSVFLKHFIEVIGSEIILPTLNYETTSVIKEEYTGRINEDYTKGGNIDIVIKDLSNQIVIENKIYANDQPNQLVRYKSYYKNCTLLYLTPFGDSPSKESKGNLIEGQDFYLINYKYHIKSWLEKCLLLENCPILIKETIRQYYICVCNITNQNTSVKMNNEIKQLITLENIEAIKELSHNFNEIIFKTKSDFYSLLNEKFIFNEKINDIYRLQSLHAIDNDGFYIGICLFDGLDYCNIKDKGLEIYDKIKENFKDIEFEHNESKLVWYNPFPFKRGQKFEDLEIKEIYKLYTDDEYLKSFVEIIVNTNNDILDFIKNTF